MMRTLLTVIAGFLAWLISWVGGETILSTLFPEGYSDHQRAFHAAIENGGPFRAATSLLLVQIVLGSIASVISGFLAAVIARENRRASLILGYVLLALGVLKMVLSWAYVPLWYHVIFTAMLLPMTIAGARLRTRQ